MFIVSFPQIMNLQDSYIVMISQISLITSVKLTDLTVANIFR